MADNRRILVLGGTSSIGRAIAGHALAGQEAAAGPCGLAPGPGPRGPVSRR